MQIVLNADLQPTEVHEYTQKSREQRRKGGHKEFGESFIFKMRDIAAPIDASERYPKPDAKLVRSLGDHERTQTGFVNVVAEAYSSHLGLVLHPHDIWYVVLSNIAAIVGKNPKDYQGLYTTSDEKQEILVVQDHPTDINIEALIAQLRERMPVDIGMFLPELSTATPQANLAMSAAVLDAAKHFYDYGMFCCGIPFIDLRGTAEDWKAINVCAAKIAVEALCGGTPRERAIKMKLVNYLKDVSAVIAEIQSAFNQDQSKFFRDIFTKENVGSGGDLKITGWICELYHNTKQGDLIRSFHDGISSFPYKNVSTGQHFMMYHGAFGSNVTDGAIEIAYDHVTIEYKPKA